MHLVLTPLRDENGLFSVAEIMQGIKSSSAHQINRALHRTGQVWQHESFDHVLRQEEGVAAKVDYVIQNPVRAGLVRNASESYDGYGQIKREDSRARSAEFEM